MEAKLDACFFDKFRRTLELAMLVVLFLHERLLGC